MLTNARRTGALLVVISCALASCSSADPAENTRTVTPSAPAASATPGPTGSHPSFGSTVVTGLDVPWGLAFLPDRSALVTQRDQRSVLHLRAGVQPRTVATVSDARPDQEGGLLGIAVSPEFATDKRVFVYYTAAGDNRVERMKWTGSTLKSDKVILSGIPKASFHNGGRLAFGPDNQLYVTTGDAGVPSRAPDIENLGGKILRITQDGKAATGNPISGSRVWSYGHRNVQGIAWDDDRRMYATEFGQNTFDELNLITPGKNYGWPTVEGKANRRGFIDPLVQWRTSESSPSGLAINGDNAYVAALAGQRVWQVPLRDGKAGTPARASMPALGRVRTVHVDPSGALWVMSNNTFRGDARDGDDRIIRWEPK